MPSLRASALVTLAALPYLGLGCAQKKAQVWEPRAAVHWEHIITEPVPVPSNGYHLLVQKPTRGLFPASIGVTRVAIAPPKRDIDPTAQLAAHKRPQLITDPRNEFLQWNRAFDDLMAVSDAFPVKEKDLGGGPATPEQILAASYGLDAGIALIYAVNEPSPDTAAMFGLLYDTQTLQPLATVHAQADSVPPDHSTDQNARQAPWETDARARVRARFERLVHSCVRDLIMQDEPALSDPESWPADLPSQPTIWPPHPLRRPR